VVPHPGCTKPCCLICFFIRVDGPSHLLWCLRHPAWHSCSAGPEPRPGSGCHLPGRRGAGARPRPGPRAVLPGAHPPPRAPPAGGPRQPGLTLCAGRARREQRGGCGPDSLVSCLGGHHGQLHHLAVAPLMSMNSISTWHEMEQI
jgi:hypothetical protein